MTVVLAWAASAALGLAAAILVHTLAAAVLRPPAPPAESWDVEAARRERLRAGSATFDWFEPLIDELARQRWLVSAADEASLGRDLRIASLPLPWTVRLFLATALCESVLIAIAFTACGFAFGWVPVWVIVGLLAGGISYLAAVMRLKGAAKRRVQAIRTRLPFAVDLMSLMVEAGADFPEAVKTLAAEADGDEAAREFRGVYEAYRSGQGLTEALVALRDKFEDPDLAEFVNSVCRSEELGSPIAATLRIQADQMLLRRHQRVEAASQRAQVHIVYPGFLIMIACLLLVIAPIGLLMRHQMGL